ncbi:sensor histidine kinase [Enterocloster sp.]|uniref:sensor histidine kinase n=1 Tax=Enterocloster sp. TaxID=2719315 RepID=UPI003AF646C8
MEKSGVSLEKKVKRIAVCAGAVVFFSIGVNLAVSWFGLGSFGSILEQNAGSLAFWSAMEEERLAFARYVGTALPEERERFEQSRMETRRRLEELPVDYRETGSERYARTWSIRNMYENYETELEVLEETDREDPEYVNRLYRIYRVQNYLKDKAGQLEQMTMEDGSERYEKHRFLFSVLPAASILWGITALWMVKRLNGSVRRNIVEPVVMLAGQADRIRKNDFSGPELTAEGEDEISRLIRSFNKMKQATRGYIEALKEKNETERQLEAVRLQLLKNQINPHFLFNTLNMIAGTAQIEDAAATEKMIQALSRLFRYNLKSTASVMPLERELKVVQDYMYLQQMRFGKRVQYETGCDPETMEILVPSFMLQPLVENAVKHGISARSKGGRIVVRTWKQGQRLWISVADTGEGIDEDKLEKIKRALKEGDGSGVGIGLGNIARRLKAMYEDGEVRIESRKGCATVVQLAFTPENCKEDEP